MFLGESLQTFNILCDFWLDFMADSTKIKSKYVS